MLATLLNYNLEHRFNFLETSAILLKPEKGTLIVNFRIIFKRKGFRKNMKAIIWEKKPSKQKNAK